MSGEEFRCCFMKCMDEAEFSIQKANGTGESGRACSKHVVPLLVQDSDGPYTVKQLERVEHMTLTPPRIAEVEIADFGTVRLKLETPDKLSINVTVPDEHGVQGHMFYVLRNAVMP